MYQKMYTRRVRKAGCRSPNTGRRVSERRSPEQGENGSAGCWPQKIHPPTQLLQAQAKTRSTRKHPGCKQSRTDFAQSIGKNTTGRNNRPRLTASRIAKLSEDGPRFQPKLLRTGRYMPRLFIWKTQRLRSKPGPFLRNIPDITIIALQTIFPKDSGYFGDSMSRNIWNISGKRFPKYSEYFEKMVGFPKYLEYFGKLVPTRNKATASSGLWPG